MSFLIEVVMDRGVDGDEYLQGSHPPETKHGPFPPSKWLVSILGSIVDPAAGFLFFGAANDRHRRAVGSQFVGD